MNQIFQVPATLTKATMKTHYWHIGFDTQENVTPAEMSRIHEWANKLGYLTFSAHQIEAEDIVDLPPIRPEAKKSPAQRLYGVLFRLWEQNPQGQATFATYYEMMMEKLINHYKEKLT